MWHHNLHIDTVDLINISNQYHTQTLVHMLSTKKSKSPNYRDIMIADVEQQPQHHRCAVAYAPSPKPSQFTHCKHNTTEPISTIPSFAQCTANTRYHNSTWLMLHTGGTSLHHKPNSPTSMLQMHQQDSETSVGHPFSLGGSYVSTGNQRHEPGRCYTDAAYPLHAL